MKRILAIPALIVAALTLSGCYYDPGYSYVRGSGYSGDAYYGRGTTLYGSGAYVSPGYHDDGYYGYGGYYGCCYAPGVSIGVNGTWYDGSHYRNDRRGYRGNDYRSNGYRDGHDRRPQGRQPSNDRSRDGGGGGHHDGDRRRRGDDRDSGH